jgi:polyhydroxyalkanoate synthase subunit PhaC
MSTSDTGLDVEARAAAVAPESGMFGSLDLAGLGAALAGAAQRAASRPGEMASAVARFWRRAAGIGPAAVAQWLGASAEPPVAVPADRRFADPAWSGNPFFFALLQGYLAAGQLGADMRSAGRSEDSVTDAKAELAAGFVFDALAPTNFLLTNPAAIKRAFETGGASVARGARNFVADVLTHGGMPRQVDTSEFELGVNLAATPGKVVFANDLMELIQYAPQTPAVRAIPMLASPPWINKYYVMDLAPGRSYLEWAVQHERTVFAISYRNPGASMRGVTLDDYLLHGPLQALEVIGDITGAPRIDIVGLCLGGALTGMLAAYLAGTGDDRLGSLTLLNTMLDYSEPGVLGAFTDERTVTRLERQMAATGYLEGRQMATTFDVIRANDLIFSYVVSGWLMGQDPPAFDILAWNADSTRMPAAMHSFYLRHLYGGNELARGVLSLAGRRLSLADVKSDAYIVGAVNDHIVPWHASYQATKLLGGDVRYALSSGGHIAGIVNPPGPKAWHEVGSTYPPEAAAWQASAQRVAGSWWPDWTEWANQRAGGLVPPPAMGSARFPPLRDAPGDYVRQSAAA